jgi:hypothetical protein
MRSTSLRVADFVPVARVRVAVARERAADAGDRLADARGRVRDDVRLAGFLAGGMS